MNLRRLATLTVSYLIAMVLVADLGALAASAEFRREVLLSTTRRPPAFSELAFSDPLELPAAIAYGAPLKVQFTIANRTGNATGYRVTVSDITPQGTITVSDARLRVLAGDRTELTVSFTPTATGQHRVVVAAGRYQIHFTVNVG